MLILTLKCLISWGFECTGKLETLEDVDKGQGLEQMLFNLR